MSNQSSEIGSQYEGDAPQPIPEYIRETNRRVIQLFNDTTQEAPDRLSTAYEFDGSKVDDSVTLMMGDGNRINSRSIVVSAENMGNNSGSTVNGIWTETRSIKGLPGLWGMRRKVTSYAVSIRTEDSSDLASGTAICRSTTRIEGIGEALGFGTRKQTTGSGSSSEAELRYSQWHNFRDSDGNSVFVKGKFGLQISPDEQRRVVASLDDFVEIAEAIIPSLSLKSNPTHKV